MLYSAFIFGLISSLHCIGMCGPIALMIPVDRTNQAKKVSQIITYHLGRLSAYAIIGLIFGIVGKGFFLAGIQQRLSIFIGIAMIITIVTPERVLANYNFSKPVYRLISKIKSSLGKQFKNKSILVFASEEQIKINNEVTLEALYNAFCALSVDLRQEIKDEINNYTI